jgi:Tfp pilus assembly protein PilV
MRKLNIQGDTIVEVLFALAFLSLAFVISYATVNRALEISQNAQEHSLATDYLDAQIEALRYYVTQPSNPAIDSSQFCFNWEFNKSIDLKNGKCLEVGNGFNYTVYIEPSSTLPATYHTIVTWSGLGSLGTQSEQLNYRVYSQ